jgi:small subunit ribosomal protein S1
MIDWQGIEGFLPASQLKPEHYPKVADGDKDKILTELQKLIGESLPVYIINVDPKESKLIFSEKATDGKSRQEIVSKYILGDVVEGEVSGLVDFGVFIRLEENFEGLIHISEIDWALVENPRDHLRVGDKIKAKVIEIKGDKISLSIKALKKNPWEGAASKYKKGETVKGVVIKYNKHGALVSIEEGVAGLVHISEFGSEEAVRQNLELGKTYPFSINLFEPKSQKLILSPIKK